MSVFLGTFIRSSPITFLTVCYSCPNYNSTLIIRFTLMFVLSRTECLLTFSSTTQSYCLNIEEATCKVLRSWRRTGLQVNCPLQMAPGVQGVDAKVGYHGSSMNRWSIVGVDSLGGWAISCYIAKLNEKKNTQWGKYFWDLLHAVRSLLFSMEKQEFFSHLSVSLGSWTHWHHQIKLSVWIMYLPIRNNLVYLCKIGILLKICFQEALIQGQIFSDLRTKLDLTDAKTDSPVGGHFICLL